MVMQAATPLDAMQRIPGVRPGARLLLHAEGETRCAPCWNASTQSTRRASPPSTCRPRTGACWATVWRPVWRCPNTPPSGMPPGWPGGRSHDHDFHDWPRAASSLAPARIVLAGFAAVGLAALAWAALQPLPRLIYNPSDSVPVGWYRVQPIDHRAASLPRRLEVGSIVLTRLPADAAALAAQRGYLPAHVPLLKRGRGRAATRLHRRPSGSHRRRAYGRRAACRPAGRPLPSWQHCRPLAEGELFLLSVTNPASFDSRYFGPVSASAVIGVAHPVRLETRP